MAFHWFESPENRSQQILTGTKRETAHRLRARISAGAPLPNPMSGGLF